MQEVNARRVVGPDPESVDLYCLPAIVLKIHGPASKEGQVLGHQDQLTLAIHQAELAVAGDTAVRRTVAGQLADHVNHCGLEAGFLFVQQVPALGCMGRARKTKRGKEDECYRNPSHIRSPQFGAAKGGMMTTVSWVRRTMPSSLWISPISKYLRPSRSISSPSTVTTCDCFYRTAVPG